MKYLLFLPVALLIGLMIGAWAPNETLRATRNELAEAKKRQSTSERGLRMDAITRMVHIPDRATVKVATNHVARTTAQHRQPGDNDATVADNTVQTNGVAETAPAETRRPPLSPEDLRARIEEAKDLWATRVQIAREQWLNRLKLTPAQAPQFDAAIDAMNIELQASIQSLADMLAADESMTPELGARLINEMSATAVRAYDELEAIVPPEQRGELAQMEMTDFIDPAVAEPLIDVQDKLENIRPPQRDPERPRIWRRQR